MNTRALLKLGHFEVDENFEETVKQKALKKNNDTNNIDLAYFYLVNRLKEIKNRKMISKLKRRAKYQKTIDIPFN